MDSPKIGLKRGTEPLLQHITTYCAIREYQFMFFRENSADIPHVQLSINKVSVSTDWP